MRFAIVFLLLAATAHADTPWIDRLPQPPQGTRPVAGFRVKGDTKVQPEILGYLAHVAIGDPLGIADIPRLEEALVSSELFETVKISLEDSPQGVWIVATVDDKQSWVAAPTIFALPGNKAVGLGFAENDFRGRDQKFLLYGQLGTKTSLFFGTFLDPAVHGSQWTWRADLYAYRRDIDEYLNPHDDPTNFDIARTTEATYLGAGFLLGWNFNWWCNVDLRPRFAYVYFRNAQAPDGTQLPIPEKDGWDVSVQAHLNIDKRIHRFGVTWGPYLQLTLEPSVPGFDSYGWQNALLRAYYSWKLFEEHELEVRTLLESGHHLPFHEEDVIGGVVDLRGYDVDQFRGDRRAVFRVEYSVPLFKWRIFAFRAIGFYDTGAIALHSPRSDRDYLPNQLSDSYTRNDVGAGIRIYVNNIVLPLLGLDVAYGIEGTSPEIDFEVGLTDF